MQLQDSLAHRYQAIQAKIQQLSADTRQPELVAVSKGQPPEKVEALFRLGQRRFAENYAQELVDKAFLLRELPIEWVYIGQLQSNKIKKIVQFAHEIQTVDSLRHAKRIALAAQQFGKTAFPIMIQVNADSEESKGGVAPSEAISLAEDIQKELPMLKIRGIMAIPSASYQDAKLTSTPQLYKDLRTLANHVGEGLLSLGMSGDMRLAIQAGSDMLRIGTALLGPR